MSAKGSDPIRLAIAGESELVTEGVRAMLDSRIPPFTVVAPGSYADVALIDPTLPGRAEPVGDRIRDLARQADHVVLFSWRINSLHDLLVREHRLSGALSKASDGATLAAALDRVVGGERVVMLPTMADRHQRLAPRETQCLSLLARGLTNREIGEHLGVSAETVKTMLSRSYAKIGVRNRAQAAAWAIRSGFADAA